MQGEHDILTALRIKEALDKSLVELYLTRDSGLIEAIKLMRQATHFGLKESKEYVEELCKNKSFKINIAVPGYMYRDMLNQLTEKYGHDCTIMANFEDQD